MGGFDIYCALCGASFSILEPFGAEDTPHLEAYDPEIITEEEMGWLGDYRVLGYNADSFTVNKCFITGRASDELYGRVDCKYGDDPNVPRDTNDLDMGNFVVYSGYDPGESFGAPFHDACYGVFAQALRYQLSGRIKGVADLGLIDKDILYSAMNSKHRESYCHLDLDYGELNTWVEEQYWSCQPGHEAWVSNPFWSSKISTYFDSLKNAESLTQDHSLTDKTTNNPGSHSANPFTKLADELIYEIILCLPYSDLRNFALSGTTAIQLSHAPAFWNRKIFIDMPWFWDLPSLAGRRDFFNLYHELRRQCFATSAPTYVDAEEEGEDNESGIRVVQPRDRSLVLGLANRRRVWGACSELAEVYIKKLQSLGSGTVEVEPGKLNEITRDSVSLQMPIVAAPVSKDTKALCTYFISSWGDMEKEVAMAFHFQDDGRLCGVEIGFAGTFDDSKLFGERAVIGGSIEIVEIPIGSWITGFELTICNAGDLSDDIKIGVTGVKVLFGNSGAKQLGESEGDKRLMTVVKDHVITGILGELAVCPSSSRYVFKLTPLPNGIIQRIALLQCPREPSVNQTPPLLPSLQNHLWKCSLPPPSLTASTYETGYWPPQRPFGTIQMQALVFGTTEEELKLVVGFSSGVNLKGFAVLLSDGSERCIGVMGDEERKVFAIDGLGGEFVTKVEVGMNALPMAIKITTNRSRFAFFGHTQKNYHMVYSPDSASFIAGIYVSWGHPECTTISILSAAREGYENVEVVGVRDDTVWSPQEPSGGYMSGSLADYIAVVDEKDRGDYIEQYW